jgi:hydrogenase large subunit
VNLDKDNVIRNAVSTGTMWRGLEVILKGRDPRDAWAFTERICGVCTGTHALTSVRAVEDALAIKIPENANTIRNLMQLNLYVHDHLVHFYHLHALDWVDVVSALKADPKATSELAQSEHLPLAAVLARLFQRPAEPAQEVRRIRPARPFANGYWGNPAYKLPPEANLMAVAHYLEALDFQKEIVKVHTIFGGKNPHPNWLVGGVPCAINVNGTGAVGAINMERLNLVKSIIERCKEFVEQVYIPDLLAIASFYKGWLYGGGLSSQRCCPTATSRSGPTTTRPGNLLLPRGAIIGGNLDKVHEVDLKDPEQIQEFVEPLLVQVPDETKGLHPFDGVTEPSYKPGPNFKGTRTNIENLDESAKYSWIKAPRWRGNAMEVGCAGAHGARLRPGQAGPVQGAIDAVLKKLDVPVTALFSTLGRTAARGIETLYCAATCRCSSSTS